MSCTPSVRDKTAPPSQAADLIERTPYVKYDEDGRITGLFGLRTEPSGDPTCRLRVYTVDFVNFERSEYLVFQLPSTFGVWVKLVGDMQRMFADSKNMKTREFMSANRKFKLTAYLCDAIGHSSYETVSVEALD